MDIEFVCEHCGKTLKVQEHLAGQSIECYHCQGPVTVPMPGQKAVIEFQCLGCGSQFRVPGSRAGSRTKCPKCDALLVVPDAARAAAPPPETTLRPAAAAPPPQPTGYEDLPPPTSPFLRKHGTIRRRPTRPGQTAPGAEDEDFIPPPANKVSVGMILFWVGLAGIFLIALLSVMMRKEPAQEGGTSYEPLYAAVKHEGALNVFQVTNTMRETWHNATFTIETDQGEFRLSKGEVTTNQVLLLEAKQFVGPGGATLAPSAGMKRFIIAAQLPNGRPAQYVLRMGGVRKPPEGATPEAPKPAEPPTDGGAVVE